jgi:hypothetical protein
VRLEFGRYSSQSITHQMGSYTGERGLTLLCSEAGPHPAVPSDTWARDSLGGWAQAGIFKGG